MNLRNDIRNVAIICPTLTMVKTTLVDQFISPVRAHFRDNENSLQKRANGQQ
nr:hypothetical protein [Listeria monocytogenes]